VGTLLAEYDTLALSLEVIHVYLEKSRKVLHELPESHGRACLFTLTEFLARQTSELGVCA
jgi:geranylgeranyl pyrophosphate synthase